MLEHVARLVDLAALDDAGRPPHLADGLAERLAAVDPEQLRPGRIQTAGNEVGQQRARHRGVLRPALVQPENPLVPLGRNPQRDQHAVVREVDPVDEDRLELQVLERRVQPLAELRGTHGDESSRHRTLRRRPIIDPRWQRVPSAVVAARRRPGVNRLPKLTPYRRPIVTPSVGALGR